MYGLSRKAGFLFCVIIAVTLLTTVAFAEGSVLEGVDECEDFSMVYEQSGQLHIENVSNNEIYFYDNMLTFMRNATTEEWVTYKIPDGNKLTVETYFWPSEEIVDFKFFVSGDNINWNEYTPKRSIHSENAEGVDKEELSEDKDERKWDIVTYTLDGIPEGSQYVKIVWGNLTTGNFWAQIISKVVSEPKGSPQTADFGVMAYVITFGLSGAAFVALRKRQK